MSRGFFRYPRLPACAARPVRVRDESHAAPAATTADNRMSRPASPSVRRRPTCAVSGVRVPRSDGTGRQFAPGPTRLPLRAALHRHPTTPRPPVPHPASGPGPRSTESIRSYDPALERRPARSTRAVERPPRARLSLTGLFAYAFASSNVYPPHAKAQPQAAGGPGCAVFSRLAVRGGGAGARGGCRVRCCRYFGFLRGVTSNVNTIRHTESGRVT